MAGIHPVVGGLGCARAGYSDFDGGGGPKIHGAARGVSTVDFREGVDVGAVVNGRVDSVALAGGPLSLLLRDSGAGFFEFWALRVSNLAKAELTSCARGVSLKVEGFRRCATRPPGSI